MVLALALVNGVETISTGWKVLASNQKRTAAAFLARSPAYNSSMAE